MHLILLCLPAALFALSLHFGGEVALALVTAACFGLLYALLVLVMSPDKTTKRNAASYLVGFLVVTFAYGLMAYEMLRSQQSPWFQ